MEYRTRLKIADIIFQIFCTSQRPIAWLNKNYKPFLSSEQADLQVFLRFYKKGQDRTNSFLMPSAKWHNGHLYARLRFFNVDINFVEHKAEVSADYEAGIINLIRFLSSVILIEKDGFLLHASSVWDKGASYVFFGPSESGKTTIARLSKDKVVLSDETTAIVKNNGSYYAYATPFFGEFGQVRQNISGPIKAIFSINRDIRFRHCLLKPINAIKEMFRNTVINIADFKTVDCLFNTLGSVAKRIPCYELSFRPEPKIWEYINGFVK